MQIAGMITAMVTPFDEQQQINYEASKKLVNTLIEKGVHGLFILGSNGEFHVLSKEEKIAFVKAVVSDVDGRVPVYAGSGGNATKEVIELSNQFADCGVQAVSVITPYLVPLTQPELICHYESIADACHVPVILYNIAKNTGNNIDPASVSRLAKHPNIIAIKDSSGDLNQIKAYIELTKDTSFAVLSGSDSLILKALQAGAKGAIAATSNLLTENDVAIYTSFQQGDIKAAQRYQDHIEHLRRVLTLGSIPSVLKAAMNMMDLPVGLARNPVMPLADAAMKQINDMVNSYVR